MRAVKKQKTTFTVEGYACIQLKANKKGIVIVPDESWIGKNLVIIKTEK